MFEPLDPPETWRRRQPHPVGKLHIAEAGVGLQLGDDPAVDGIQADFGMIVIFCARQGRYIASDLPQIAQFARTRPAYGCDR
jgi:hypothetical protein